jgi:hypothetical protein
VTRTLEDYFPRLRAPAYTVTSDATQTYNCIAWAAEDQSSWWWPDPQMLYFWPDAVPRAETLEAFVAAYELHGYERCDDSTLQPGFQKVALFANANGVPTHAARQLPDGRWTSKLGAAQDITHQLDDVGGADYGEPRLFMRRPGGA